jgi:hypothetical protein
MARWFSLGPHFINMKPSELFGFFIRATGFGVILYSLWNLWSGCELVMENILPLSEGSESDLSLVFYYFAFGIPMFVAGAACFFLADWIVRLAYRGRSKG